MPPPYYYFSQSWNDLKNSYATVKQNMDYAQANIAIAYTGCSDPVDKLHYGYLHYAVQTLWVAIWNMGRFTEEYHINSHLWRSIYLAWDEAPEPPPPEITMSDILKAMSEAEPHQPLLFVGYLEAYKASVWNASFDETYFADLVKKWAIWG